MSETNLQENLKKLIIDVNSQRSIEHTQELEDICNEYEYKFLVDLSKQSLYCFEILDEEISRDQANILPKGDLTDWKKTFPWCHSCIWKCFELYGYKFNVYRTTDISTSDCPYSNPVYYCGDSQCRSPYHYSVAIEIPLSRLAYLYDERIPPRDD